MAAQPATPAETLLDPAVEAYLERLLPPRDAVLRAMERLARREKIPIVGPACGRLLALLVHLTKARRIFEMGSAIGYSTLWLARAAGPRARVFYTDSDPARAQRARQFFQRAGVLPRVRLLIGDALDCLARTPGSFDLIFVDVDKEQYPAALRLALPPADRRGAAVAGPAEALPDTALCPRPRRSDRSSPACVPGSRVRRRSTAAPAAARRLAGKTGGRAARGQDRCRCRRRGHAGRRRVPATASSSRSLSPSRRCGAP